jgi:hypothetical protein
MGQACECNRSPLNVMKKNLILFIVLLLLGVAAWMVYRKNTGSTLSEKPLADFAIEDTASITRFVITDQLGQQATVERIPGKKLWRLNGKYYAREDAVNLLLLTCKRLAVRGSVSAASRDNYMKLLATSGKKVEIYQGGNEPAKIYYVGVSTADHTGTIMLLEIPGIGRSEEPFITHLEGFTGFLTTRFFASEMEWRYTGIFDYPHLEFNDVRVLHNLEPAESFEVKYLGGNNIELYSGYDPATSAFTIRENTFDSLAVKNLLLLFKKVHVDTYNTMLRPDAQDSLLHTTPAYTLEVTGNDGTKKKMDLYLKRATKVVPGENGQPNPWDVDYFWGRSGDGEFALAQTFNFGPLVLPLRHYLGRR